VAPELELRTACDAATNGSEITQKEVAGPLALAYQTYTERSDPGWNRRGAPRSRHRAPLRVRPVTRVATALAATQTRVIGR
jgi:hypothetical protein